MVTARKASISLTLLGAISANVFATFGDSYDYSRKRVISIDKLEKAREVQLQANHDSDFFSKDEEEEEFASSNSSLYRVKIGDADTRDVFEQFEITTPTENGRIENIALSPMGAYAIAISGPNSEDCVIYIGKVNQGSFDVANLYDFKSGRIPISIGFTQDGNQVQVHFTGNEVDEVVAYGFGDNLSERVVEKDSEIIFNPVSEQADKAEGQSGFAKKEVFNFIGGLEEEGGGAEDHTKDQNSAKEQSKNKDEQQADSDNEATNKPKSFIGSRWVKITAATALVGGVSYVAWKYLSKKSPKKEAKHHPVNKGAAVV